MGVGQLKRSRRPRPSATTPRTLFGLLSCSVRIKDSVAKELTGIPQPAMARIVHAVDSLREQSLAGTPLKGGLRGLRRLSWRPGLSTNCWTWSSSWSEPPRRLPPDVTNGPPPSIPAINRILPLRGSTAPSQPKDPACDGMIRCFEKCRFMHELLFRHAIATGGSLGRGKRCCTPCGGARGMRL